jgi:1,4-alpha-glucan branching enzyme
MNAHGKGLKGKKRITFSLMAPQARQVSLAADFNQWSQDKHPMKKGKYGEWTRTVFVDPGEYEYKFWVDGEWKIDERNSRTRRNRFGTRNNIVNVAPTGKKPEK